MQTEYLAIYIALVICLLWPISGQNVCQNCLNTTYNFVCNNIWCQGFEIASSNQHNFNKNSVMCNTPNRANGGNNCFYPSSINSTTVIYLFCNYTISGCYSCSSAFSCASCFKGFYLYSYNLTNKSKNCQSCSVTMPGCLYSIGQNSCTQCYPGYFYNGGVCYYLN